MFSYAEEKKSSAEEMIHHHMKHSINDGRISLGLSPEMKQHQLSNMRSHLKAVQAITSFLAEEEFEKASEIAHSKLGLTEEMRKMCNMFNNEDFTALGLAFHESGDSLGQALKTKDTTKSLRALKTTLGYCVQCHATFRQ
ncbi:MAG: cytochrome c [Proteobacteria bacterium]|nr:cytochrome C [Pseudomonadota bacterium]NOG60477.1 cytochrome c [Pseudomonadota bacterium]